MRNRIRRWLRSSEAGYTLVEMLVVIGIIALIAALLVPNLIGQMQRARAKTAQVQLENIASAVEMFRSDTGRYPNSTDGAQPLVALLANGSGIEGWTGPYLKDAKTLKDPWNNPVKYQVATDALSFTVSSEGADGKPGGVGANLDLQAPAAPGAAATPTGS